MEDVEIALKKWGAAKIAERYDETVDWRQVKVVPDWEPGWQSEYSSESAHFDLVAQSRVGNVCVGSHDENEFLRLFAELLAVPITDADRAPAG